MEINRMGSLEIQIKPDGWKKSKDDNDGGRIKSKSVTDILLFEILMMLKNHFKKEK